MSKITDGNLKGMLMYCTVQQPRRGFKAEGTTEEPGFEWSASVVVTDEDYVDNLEAEMQEMNAKGISIKKVKTADFKTKYKIDPPEDAGKNVWILKVKKSCTLGKTGKEVPEIYRPKVFQRKGGTLLDITNSTDKIVANGSIGQVSIDPFFRKTNGTTQFYLKNVLVETLIPYEPNSHENVVQGSEFGIVGEAPAAEAPKAKAAPVSKAKPKAVEDLDDDLPF